MSCFCTSITLILLSTITASPREPLIDCGVFICLLCWSAFNPPNAHLSRMLRIRVFHYKCKVLSASTVTVQLQTRYVILTLSEDQGVRNGCPLHWGKPANGLYLVQNTRCEVVRLKNTRNHEIQNMIINVIHVEFKDIHWEEMSAQIRATTVPPSALGEDKEAFRKKDGLAGQTIRLA